VPALYTPWGGVADNAGDIWVLNTAIVSSPAGYGFIAPNTVGLGLTELTPSYSTNPTTGALVASYTPTVTTGGDLPGLATPEYLAIDGGNNIWMDSQAVSSPGPSSSFAEYSINGAVWLSPNTTTTITTTRNASGWFGGNTGTSTQRVSQSRRGLAVDGSGNVWTVNNSSAGNTLGILVGAAVPAVTPISLAIKNNAIGTRP
jgi:hypothetical protein